MIEMIGASVRSKMQDPVNADRTAPVSQAFPAGRLYFIDNLRVLLAVLVVTHHAGQPYGPGGAWWIPNEPSGLVGTMILGSFFAVNMSFFMGLFFMVSAYFVPGSLQRKGAGRFYNDRLVRLGVPMAVFAFLIFPMMYYFLHGFGVTSFGDYYVNTYMTVKGMAEGQGFTLWHLWFLEQLLIFSGFYVLWRRATGSRPASQEAPRKVVFPSNLTIAVFAIALGLAMFAVRVVFPVNVWLPIVSLEPAHYPEYIALFIAGILAFRNDWFNALPAATARKWGYVTLLAVLALFPMMAVFGNLIEGGLTLSNLVMSLWEAIVCTGMCISLVYLFRTRFNFQGKLAKALADSSFTVYLIHIPVVVFLQWLLIGVNVHPLVKFAIVCLIGVPACFLLSHYVVRRLPLAKYVL